MTVLTLGLQSRGSWGQGKSSPQGRQRQNLLSKQPKGSTVSTPLPLIKNRAREPSWLPSSRSEIRNLFQQAWVF